ncbi:MAG: ribonucleoside-triphosphate reductase [Actinobacteria bacterium]|nr:ribonucleoside-triphosphate reductase [Actinomycetota bacterium]
MDLKEKILEVSKSFPAEFRTEKDGSLSLEFIVAERKAFLSRKTLKYRARLRVNDENKVVNFFEILKESGAGLSSSDDMSPGFGFKAGVSKISGKEREGNITELSNLFGKEYKYSFDFAKIRNVIKSEAEKLGYSINIVLLERNV